MNKRTLSQLKCFTNFFKQSQIPIRLFVCLFILTLQYIDYMILNTGMPLNICILMISTEGITI